ncbi:MAG: bifunctional 4-hydroxy-2-oxoglutarate aldolase/2-dehydro-3-deoxy-phosphogluconate aldolase [Firmicutes bacterium]|nr:bifunctional 4-hydroxy-2-oxoglutarate aldolase/2-dehydro-3-deoxy-phosphogluconate aldolase [Bacillota bacterium]
MTSEELAEQLRAERILAIVRASSAEEAEQRAMAALEAGIHIIEVSWTTPEAGNVIKRLSGQVPVLGAGTVLTPSQAVASWEAGARFVVAPNWSPGVAAQAQEHGMAYVPGVFSAQEVGAAVEAGYRLLKLFPASTGGVAHMKALADPFPGLQWVPTGGVTWENAGEWIRAGAVAVGMGQHLWRTDRPAEVVKALRSI